MIDSEYKIVSSVELQLMNRFIRLESTTAEPVGTDFTIWSSYTHIICNKFEVSLPTHYSKGIFQPSELQELKQLYGKLFSVPEYSLELPVSYRKYTTLKLNGKQLGSHRSRSSSSSVVKQRK